MHRSLQRSLSFLFAATLFSAFAGCLATNDGPADESMNGDGEHEALTGSLPVGTQLQTTTALNFRSGPSTSNSVIDVLPGGTIVTLAASAPSNGFYNVTYEGTTGWCSGTYLEPAQGGATVATSASTSSSSSSSSSGAGGGNGGGATLTATGNVNLRSGPGTSYSILEVVPVGALVTEVSPTPSNGFYNIDYNGTVGWSSASYLTPTSSTGTGLDGGTVFTFHASTLSMQIGVFVSGPAMTASDVDVIVYSHGLNVCTPVATNPPESFLTDAPFDFAELVANNADKPVVFVAPWFDWENLAADGMEIAGTTHHKLAVPKNLNGVVAEVMNQVAAHTNAPAPNISSFIVAGHSRAYDFLDPIADAWNDPQMNQGALAKLSQVWAFDITYVCDTSSYMSLLKSKPNLTMSAFYRPGTETASCGQALANQVSSSGGRLKVTTAGEEHCEVPDTRMPPLLSALP